MSEPRTTPPTSISFRADIFSEMMFMASVLTPERIAEQNLDVSLDFETNPLVSLGDDPLMVETFLEYMRTTTGNIDAVKEIAAEAVFAMPIESVDIAVTFLLSQCSFASFFEHVGHGIFETRNSGNQTDLVRILKIFTALFRKVEGAGEEAATILSAEIASKEDEKLSHFLSELLTECLQHQSPIVRYHALEFVLAVSFTSESIFADFFPILEIAVFEETEEDFIVLALAGLSDLSSLYGNADTSICAVFRTATLSADDSSLACMIAVAGTMRIVRMEMAKKEREVPRHLAHLLVALATCKERSSGRDDAQALSLCNFVDSFLQELVAESSVKFKESVAMISGESSGAESARRLLQRYLAVPDTQEMEEK